MASRSGARDSDPVNDATDHGPSDGERRSARTPGVVRIALVLVLGLVILLPMLWLVAWFRFAGGRGGWILTATSFAALCATTGWVAVPRRWPEARRTTATVLALVAALLGVMTAHTAPPTPGRLRHEIARIAQPGWRLSDDHVDGNAACLDSCTSVTREYRVDAPPAEVASALRPLLLGTGYETAPGGADGRIELRRDGGEFDMSVDIAVGSRDTSLVVITAST